MSTCTCMHVMCCVLITRFSRTGGGEDIDFDLRLGTPMRCVPGACCAHPQWKDVHRHIMGWGFSDSLLLSIYPNHTYCNYPNIIELSFFLILAFIALGFYQEEYVKSSLKCFVLLIGGWFIDVGWDAYRHWFDFCESFTVIEILQSNVIKNSIELGHFLGPMYRFDMKMCHRFDWFCGHVKGFRGSERRHALRVFASVVLGYMAMVACTKLTFYRQKTSGSDL